MPVTRGLDIAIRTSADTSGAKQASAAVDQVKQQTIELAKAQGLSEASVQKVAAAYDELTSTFNALEEATQNGTLTNEEALVKWVEAERKAAAEMKALGVEAGVAGKKLEETAKGFRITRENGVMMGNMLAGLVTQIGLGADGSQLLASGMTNVAMILSTIPGYGVAAGFALQAFTAIVVNWNKAEEEAAKAAAKDAEAMKKRADTLKEVRREQEGWEASIRKTVEALDAETAALERRAKAEKEDRERKEKQAALDKQISDQEIAARVASGEMSQEEVRASQISDEIDAMDAEHANRLKEIEDEEDAADRKIADAEKKLAINQAAVKEQEARETSARRVEVGAKEFDENQKTLKALEAELVAERTAAAEAGTTVPPERVQELREQIDAAKSYGSNLNRAITQEKTRFRDLGTVDEESEDARLAREAFEKLRGPLVTQKAEAEAARQKAIEDREAANDTLGKRRTIYEGNLKTPEERQLFDRFTEGNEGEQARYARQDRIRDQAGQMQREEKFVGSQVKQLRDGLKDGADDSELSEVAGLLNRYKDTNSAAIREMLTALKSAVATANKALNEVKAVKAQVQATN